MVGGTWQSIASDRAWFVSLPRAAAARSPCWPLPGAIVATLTELIEPFGLNDNVTIPVFSSIALQFGFSRISSCHIGQGQGVALLKEIFSNLNLWSQSTGMAPVDGPP